MLSWHCFLVPTKRTLPPRSAVRLRKAYDSSSRARRLLQVDDVDAAALAEDVRLHLGVPAARLVAEVDAAREQVLHARGVLGGRHACLLWTVIVGRRNAWRSGRAAATGPVARLAGTATHRGPRVGVDTTAG